MNGILSQLAFLLIDSISRFKRIVVWGSVCNDLFWDGFRTGKEMTDAGAQDSIGRRA